MKDGPGPFLDDFSFEPIHISLFDRLKARERKRKKKKVTYPGNARDNNSSLSNDRLDANRLMSDVSERGVRTR